MLHDFIFSMLSFEHHSSEHADTEDIEPALAEVEQVRVEQRPHYVADYDSQSVPTDQRPFAEQSQVSDPHRNERKGPDEPELDRHGENLIVRIARDRRSHASVA